MNVIGIIGSVIMSVANSIATIVNSISGFFKSLFDLISGVILGIASSFFGNLFNKKSDTKMTNYESSVLDYLDSIVSCLNPFNKKEAITSENKSIITPETNVNLINKTQSISGLATSVLHIEEYLKIISENSIIKTEAQKIVPFFNNKNIKSSQIKTTMVASDSVVNNIHQGASQLNDSSSSIIEVLKESNQIISKILTKLDSFTQNKKIIFPTIENS